MSVRRADAADAETIGRLLKEFNAEYHEPAPPLEVLAKRLRELMQSGDTKVLLAGEPAVGLALLRFRRSLWTPGLECYLAELYVAPGHRGKGLGRALMEAALDLAKDTGADGMDLNTSEDDRAARALYESLGFTNREGRPDGPIMYFYEREWGSRDTERVDSGPGQDENDGTTERT